MSGARFVAGTARNGGDALLDTETGVSFYCVSGEARALAEWANTTPEGLAEVTRWNGTHDPEGFTPYPTLTEGQETAARFLFGQDEPADDEGRTLEFDPSTGTWLGERPTDEEAAQIARSVTNWAEGKALAAAMREAAEGDSGDAEIAAAFALAEWVEAQA